MRKRIEGPPSEVLPHLRALGPRLIAVYEAGPTGFGLARAGREAGLDIRIAASGLIPKAPTDRVKTDRRDAERLARLLAAGQLRFVHLPSVAEERFRDLIRCREDLRGDLMRARHRPSKLLLRHGLRHPGPGGSARRLLVEAAHHHARNPVVGATLRRRQEGQDPRVCQIAWRAQRRIHRRWSHLRLERGKPAGKVAVACARELACFAWEAAVLD